MALLFCDSCDAYTAVTDMALKGWKQSASWASSYGAFAPTGGKWGGGAISATNAPAGMYAYCAKSFTYSAGAVLNVGMYYKGSMSAIDNGGTNVGGIVFVGGSNPTGMIGIGGSSGFINFYPYGNGTKNATVGTHNVWDGAYHWIETQIVFGTGTSGSVKVYVDGVLDLSLTGIATVTTGTPDGTFGWAGTYQQTSYIDDFIGWDNTGSSFNSFPIGPRRIACLIPNAAGDLTQFTPSSGTNYSDVAQAYSGSASVSDTGTGNTDLYKTAGLPYTPASSINAAVVNVFAYDPSGGGTRNVIPKLKSAGTVASGSSSALSSSATNYQTPFYTDATGAAWTATNINSAQCGVGD